VRARLLCWNVAGRASRLPEQAQLIVRAATDLVCLQEVTRTTAGPWRDLLRAGGYEHVEIAEASFRDDGRRALRTLTAARSALSVIEVPGLPWPERVLAVGIDGLELVNFHSPISTTPRLTKVRAHEALHDHLAAGSGPRAVCGDFNTPRREHPDGTVWTFARTRSGKLRQERGERHDRAELALLKGLAPCGFRDAFRALYGYDVRELSWQWQGSGGGYRLDHLIASEEVSVSEVSYLHPWRHAGLSDHSPVFARLSWEPRASRP
jgi:exonuclease III